MTHHEKADGTSNSIVIIGSVLATFVLLGTGVALLLFLVYWPRKKGMTFSFYRHHSIKVQRPLDSLKTQIPLICYWDNLKYFRNYWELRKRRLNVGNDYVPSENLTGLHLPLCNEAVVSLVSEKCSSEKSSEIYFFELVKKIEKLFSWQKLFSIDEEHNL